MKRNKILFSLLIVMLVMITAVGSVSAAPFTWSGNLTTIRQGSHGGNVRAAQNICKHNLGINLVADGDFGPITNSAVRQFQQDNGLGVDGIVGNNTWAKMQEKQMYHYFFYYAIEYDESVRPNPLTIQTPAPYFTYGPHTGSSWETGVDHNNYWYALTYK